MGFASVMGVNVLIFIFCACQYNFKVFAVDEYRKSTSTKLEESKKRGVSVSYAFASRECSGADIHVRALSNDVPDSLEGGKYNKNARNLSGDIRVESVSITAENDLTIERARKPT